MSKGSTVVTLRPGNERLELIRRTIEELNERRLEEPYTLTSFIISAIDEKLSHRERSRRPRKASKRGEA
jgi:hypothetical protein